MIFTGTQRGSSTTRCAGPRQSPVLIGTAFHFRSGRVTCGFGQGWPCFATRVGSRVEVEVRPPATPEPDLPVPGRTDCRRCILD